MGASETENLFLIGEYQQAWDHYRHIENARTQYLGFFFTASLGGVALAAPILAANAGRLDIQLVSLGSFTAVFEVFALFVLMSVSRFGVVLLRYDIAMTRIRWRRARITKVRPKAATYLWTGHSPAWRSAQRAAEAIVMGFLAVGVVTFVIVVGVAVTHSFFVIGVGGSILGAGCLAATAIGAIVGHDSRKQIAEMKKELQELKHHPAGAV